MERGGALQVALLVERPGELLFPLGVIDGPGLEHTPGGDDEGQPIDVGIGRDAMRTAQPNAVLVDD